MRAGKLVSGEEGVLKAMRYDEAKLVIIAQDASANTLKKFLNKCRYFNIPYIQHFERHELGSSIGKANRVIVAVTDEGFARMIQDAFNK